MPWRFETDRSRKLRDNCLCCFVVIIHLDFFFEAEKRQEFVCFLELNIVRLWRRAIYVRKKVFLKITGAPNDCFLKNICSKKQILTTIEYSMVWGRQKISKWPSHSCMHDFRGLSDKFPTIFWSLIFHVSGSQVWVIFRRKRKPKIFGFKHLMERE